MNKDKEKRATFTPGPWHAFEQTWDASNRGLFEVSASHPSGNSQTIAVTPLKGDGNEMWANARLIAAAPELYEQCKLFERAIVELMMQGETGGDEELEKLREVLAKVDGGLTKDDARRNLQGPDGPQVRSQYDWPDDPDDDVYHMQEIH